MGSVDWIRGFEDAIELAIIEFDRAETKIAARERLTYILGIAKERKIGAIKKYLVILQDLDVRPLKNWRRPRPSSSGAEKK